MTVCTLIFKKEHTVFMTICTLIFQQQKESNLNTITGNS